jgi:hypothetical protein
MMVEDIPKFWYFKFSYIKFKIKCKYIQRIKDSGKEKEKKKLRLPRTSFIKVVDK